jgi:hypothetical protein
MAALSKHLASVMRINRFLLIGLVAIRLTAWDVQAEAVFRACTLEGQGSELLFCDLDGDRLKDIVLLEKTNLAVFFQDSNRGFRDEPDQRYGLGKEPALVWPAHLNSGAESLLLMTSEGVVELRFRNRTGTPARELIIRQPTVIPPALDNSADLALTFPLSTDTGTGWPLILVPVQGGAIQVWQHGDDWHRAQVLEGALDSRLWASTGKDTGYTTWVGMGVGVADLNGDRREDVIMRRYPKTGMAAYAVCLQGTNGLFPAEPTLTHETKPDWRSWLGWVDVNCDGKVDLIKTRWLNEPWFVPGVRSGKVVVGICLANEQGQLPSEPQQVFRKNDWNPSVPLLDLDGDGFPDLVLGYSLFDSREGARKMMTARQLDFSLRFHFYQRGTGFSREPDCRRDLVIHLDRHSLYLSSDRRESFERFVGLEGDFNGDGKLDLLVRDQSDRVSVYFFLSREQGFSREPGARFRCPDPIEWMQSQDLNNDGTSDLVVGLRKRSALRVFLSERQEPPPRRGSRAEKEAK